MTTTETATPADAIKGGDTIRLRGREREVFDTLPSSYNHTLIRYLTSTGEVRSVRVPDQQSIARVVR